jgi:ADP-ribose pyrophosphatase
VKIVATSQRIIGRGRFLELVDENGWEYVRRHSSSGVVVIVATTADNELVLVEQPRVPVHSRTIELPAGLVGDIPSSATESMAVAAARELEEETGFQATNWHLLAEGPSAVGISTEVVNFYRATDLRRTGPGGGDGTEDITVHVVPLADVPQFLADKAAAGAVIDPKVYMGLYLIHAETAR